MMLTGRRPGFAKGFKAFDSYWNKRNPFVVTRSKITERKDSDEQ